MGRDKGLVMLDKAPLVVLVRDILLQVAEEVIVSVRSDMKTKYAPVLGSSVRIVEDQHYGLGPLEGLLRALPACRGEYAIVAPCDTPFLKPALCRIVAAAAVGHDGAVPRIGGYVEPLHGAYRRRSTLRVFRECQREGNLKLQDAFASLDIAFVEEEQLRAVDPLLDSFRNLNTPEELEDAVRMMRRHG